MAALAVAVWLLAFANGAHADDLVPSGEIDSARVVEVLNQWYPGLLDWSAPPTNPLPPGTELIAQGETERILRSDDGERLVAFGV